MAVRMELVNKKKLTTDATVANFVQISSGKLGAFLIKLAISIGLIGYLLSQLDFGLPLLTTNVALLLAASVGLLLVQPIIMSLRWWLLMRASGLQVTLGDAIKCNWIAVFANQFLPASVGGDAVRIVLSRMRGLPVKTVTMTVMFDRCFALVALFLLIIVLSPAASDVVNMKIVVVLASVVCFAGLAGFISLEYLASFAITFVGSRPRLIFLQHYISRLSDLASQRAVMASALGISILVHLLSFSALSIIAYCFSVDVPLPELVAINMLVTLAHILPISIAGWGVREGAAILFYSNAGVDSSTALSISFLAGVAYAIASLPGAVLWVVRPSKKRAG